MDKPLRIVGKCAAPTAAEREFVGSLMRPVTAPGKFAGWIAPPARGVNHQPIDFDYVKP